MYEAKIKKKKASTEDPLTAWEQNGGWHGTRPQSAYDNKLWPQLNLEMDASGHIPAELTADYLDAISGLQRTWRAELTNIFYCKWKLAETERQRQVFPRVAKTAPLRLD